MAEILNKQQIDELLEGYYKEHYGERDSDEWCEQPAVNVWAFRREGRFISLKCHILNGTVEEYIE